MARPRSEKAHRAAIEATIELLVEAGLEGATLEAVACRSGVARSTLYRHFGSREGLVVEAARSCVVEHPTPDSGSLADDLRYLLGRFTDTEEETRLIHLLPPLIDAAARAPVVLSIIESVFAERKRPLRTVIQVAQARGEIGLDVDLDIAVGMVVGTLTHRLLVERRAASPELIDAVLAGAIATLRAPAGGR